MKVQKSATLDAKTVTKISKNEHTSVPAKRKKAARRPRSSAVIFAQVDPRVMEAAKQIAPDSRYIEVRSNNEVIVWNTPSRNLWPH